MAFDIRLLKSALRRFLSKINSFTHIISFIISSLFKKLRIRHSNDTAFLLSLYALFCDHLLESFLKISPPFNGIVPPWWSTSFQRALFQLKIVANKAGKWIPRQFFLGNFFLANPIFHFFKETRLFRQSTNIWSGWAKKAQQSAKNKLMFLNVCANNGFFGK